MTRTLICSSCLRSFSSDELEGTSGSFVHSSPCPHCGGPIQWSDLSRAFDFSDERLVEEFIQFFENAATQNLLLRDYFIASLCYYLTDRTDDAKLALARRILEQAKKLDSAQPSTNRKSLNTDLQTNIDSKRNKLLERLLSIDLSAITTGMSRTWREENRDRLSELELAIQSNDMDTLEGILWDIANKETEVLLSQDPLERFFDLFINAELLDDRCQYTPDDLNWIPDRDEVMQLVDAFLAQTLAADYWSHSEYDVLTAVANLCDRGNDLLSAYVVGADNPALSPDSYKYDSISVLPVTVWSGASLFSIALRVLENLNQSFDNEVDAQVRSAVFAKLRSFCQGLLRDVDEYAGFDDPKYARRLRNFLDFAIEADGAQDAYNEKTPVSSALFIFEEQKKDWDLVEWYLVNLKETAQRRLYGSLLVEIVKNRVSRPPFQQIVQTCLELFPTARRVLDSRAEAITRQFLKDNPALDEARDQRIARAFPQFREEQRSIAFDMLKRTGDEAVVVFYSNIAQAERETEVIIAEIGIRIRRIESQLIRILEKRQESVRQELQITPEKLWDERFGLGSVYVACMRRAEEDPNSKNASIFPGMVTKQLFRCFSGDAEQVVYSELDLSKKDKPILIKNITQDQKDFFNIVFFNPLPEGSCTVGEYKLVVKTFCRLRNLWAHGRGINALYCEFLECYTTLEKVLHEIDKPLPE